MTAYEVLNAASDSEAKDMLVRCCGASRWVDGMLSRRPFNDDEALFRVANDVWATMRDADVLEALEHHPRIGANLDELRKKYASTASWALGEQSGAVSADEVTLTALRDGNVEYEKRFGHIFVVCATGKTAAQMLELLRARLPNDAATELRIAAAEQAKITRIRLEKLA